MENTQDFDNEKIDDVKIGVALSSGGILGLSHIGFLQVLEENGIFPSVISGCSMGSVVGGLYASGVSLKEIEKIFVSMNSKQFMDVKIFTALKSGLMSGNKFEELFKEYAKTDNFDELKIPFYCVATNLLNGEIVKFNSGSLSKAVRASSSMPGFFKPVQIDDMLLVDGALKCIVPFNDLRDYGADIVIAVNCANGVGLESNPKNVIQILMSMAGIYQNDLWKNEQIQNSEKYDLYVRNSDEKRQTISLDSENIPGIIENGRESARKILPELFELIEKQKEIKKQHSIIESFNEMERKNIERFYTDFDTNTGTYVEQTRSLVEESDFFKGISYVENSNSQKTVSNTEADSEKSIKTIKIKKNGRKKTVKDSEIELKASCELEK